MMKNINIIIIFFLFGMMSSCLSQPGWKLVWEEEFNKDGVIDETVWSKIPRGSSDWVRFYEWK